MSSVPFWVKSLQGTPSTGIGEWAACYLGEISPGQFQHSAYVSDLRVIFMYLHQVVFSMVHRTYSK